MHRPRANSIAVPKESLPRGRPGDSMKAHFAPMSSMTLACAVALLLLAGCSSGGSGSGVSPSAVTPTTPPPPNTPAATPDTTPAAKVTEGTGNTVMATGNAVSDIGKQIQAAQVPLLPDATRNALGGVVVN